MTAPDTSQSAASETSSLTRLQKFAVLLLMLGPETAAQILQHCDEKEIEAVAVEMVRLNIVSQEVQAEVLVEFAQVAVHAGTAVSGGAEVVRATLEKAVGQFRASAIVRRFVPDGLNSDVGTALRPLLEAEPRELFNALRTEQPQTIALLASHLPPDKASEMLKFCPAELRDQVVERLATLSPTPIEVVEQVVAVLTRKLVAKPTRALSRSGGLKSAAAVLNALKRDVSKTVLTSIEERNPDLGKAIRQKMFTFDDVGRLEPAALQKILREVDTRDLATSLHKAGEPVKTALLSCISKRAAETVREEMSFLGSVKLRDIEAAQGRIVEVVRRLEGEGEIELNPGEESVPDEALA
ncbi:MAG: flagellar motor switch protein FliG [Verrucomicrobiota bacterium]|nr:flagellar motor switch protein FliG [Verrucomicrobiota bacterium]MCC6822529.1 flagellar motor switch protein FliG [Limisphaerales bacterium]